MNTSSTTSMTLVFVDGTLATNVIIAPGRSVTYFFEDLKSITIEAMADSTPGAACTGNLLLDLHYCVECPNY